MSETPSSDEERITALEVKVASLEIELAERIRHSMEMDALIVRLSAIVAVQAGIPKEHIDQVIKEENDKLINKLIDKFRGS
jgi:hypothetical protein